MRPRSQYNAAMYLLQMGLNDCQIGRIMNISRGTIRDWRSNGETPWRVTGQGLTDGPAGPCPGCQPNIHDDQAYSYLLGLYLGDGCISKARGVYKLRIALDAKYPHIIDECAIAMSKVKGAGSAGRLLRDGCYEVYQCWKHWPCAFPQHGPGAKHLRDISLDPWQASIVYRNPREFLRGMVQSDGCRDKNVVLTKSYPRYSFTNNSNQLHRLFQGALDQLGVHWTRPSWKNTAVSRRADVAFLDGFIGPKF